MTRQDNKDGPVRVVIQQPALSAYGIPVFQELANRGDLYGSLEWV